MHSEEPRDIDESPAAKANSWNFKCNLCDEIIDERRDYMKHKKEKHSDTILPCEKFLKGECLRTNETCWFKHPTLEINDKVDDLKATSNEQVFQKAPENAFPPDQVSKLFQMMNILCTKVEQMEKKFQDLIE